MDKVRYTGFSNYKEINIQNRKKSLENEVDKWGNLKSKFVAYRNEWNKAAEENYLPTHPLHVDIELSDICNLKCKMCVHSFEKNKTKYGLMDKELAKYIIDESSKIDVFSIKFNWRGEVTFNKYLPELVLYAKEKGILEVQINTNGIVPKNRKGILIKCAENGIDRIIFSVDGFSKETYESIRIGASYEELINNIEEVINWKNRNKQDKPFIRVQMVRTKINCHEVEPFIKYWQTKVDDVRISDVTDRGQGNDLSCGDQITYGRRRCPQPFQRLVVARDGNVSPCCADWHQEYIIGNITDDSLITLWNNDKMNYLRKIQNECKHDEINICKNCYLKESYLWKDKDDK